MKNIVKQQRIQNADFVTIYFGKIGNIWKFFGNIFWKIGGMFLHVNILNHELKKPSFLMIFGSLYFALFDVAITAYLNPTSLGLMFLPC